MRCLFHSSGNQSRTPPPPPPPPKTETIIIENVGEELDATLDPVLARAVYKKGACGF